MANSGSFSVCISALLDTMGFNREMIDFRIDNTRQRDITGVLFKHDRARLITGGKADGTSKWGQGDLDLMFIYTSIIVTDRQIETPSHRHTVLYVDDIGIHCGYTRLRVAYRGNMDNTMKRSLICISRNLKAMLFQCHSKRQIQAVTSGPAHQMLSNGIPRDIVHAFSHPEWPAQASEWANRCRRHGWPSETVVAAIVQCGCNLVPKGFKGSPTEKLEWCFSFANHETLIIQQFNLMQKQVYILLKIIANDLKKIYPEFRDLVTSYTLKIVALWQVELHHARNWDRSHLLDRLMEALDFLKSCVESQNLPAYFIAGNNLFDGKITQSTSASLSRLLNNFLCQGAGCVLTFPSMQQQLQIMQIPGLRKMIVNYWSGVELANMIGHYCQDYLAMDQRERHMLRSISLIDSTDRTRHASLTKGVSKIMKATFAYIYIAKVKKARMSNIRKYELYRPFLRIASANIDTDKIAGRVKFAGLLQVLGRTNEAKKILYSTKLRPLFGGSYKAHHRNVIHKKYIIRKTSNTLTEEVIARFGRDKYVQECVSLDVVYSIEEIDVVPNHIKYELFHEPKSSDPVNGAHVDPDMLKYYLLYKCHTQLGEKENAEDAFLNLIKIATNNQFDPYMEFRDVALNVLGLSYMEKKDFLRGYCCFCRAMCLRPQLFRQKCSSSTPWHLAVLASALIKM
ncbi:hypothetical protein CHS0354_033484 [Potamilus streckersoni]|uniref:Mab-21-like HhH/H2TH-like domain-containing protein n=1 Tax=Potamilus streckersoni TaxID=2493646 RepID=A0AAE0W6M2_9BIVA|nr:hypothetical protein CHS0354_033484 [Potamilus streckersoni]